MTTKDEFDRAVCQAVAGLLSHAYGKEVFEDLCKQAWIDHNGPVPEGRELVVGLCEGRVMVGHRFKQPLQSAESMGIRFPSLGRVNVDGKDRE